MLSPFCNHIRKCPKKLTFLFSPFLIVLLCLLSACSFDDAGDMESSEDMEYEDEYEGLGPISIAEIQGSPWYETGCDFSGLHLITDLTIQPVPSLPEPQARVIFTDPIFGTCIIRVTDRNADLNNRDISGGMKNEYSRVQSFNADETLLVAFTTDGNWHLYDAYSLQPLGQLPIWHEPRWDATDPDLLYYSEDTRLLSYRISTSQQQLVHNFAEDFSNQNLAAVWMRYEGSPSTDGRYWGLMAEDQEWMTVAILIYDLQRDQVIAIRDLPPSEIDAVTISPLGTYLVAYYDNYCEEGQLGTDRNPCGFMVYDSNLENGRGLLRIIGHSDPAIDAQGNEVLIYQDIDTDNISMVDLASGTVTALQPIDFRHSAIGFHFSGRAFQLPGWALVSTSNGTNPSSTWMEDQVFAIELIADGRVVRLAHTHSVYNENIEHDYWAEPHGSVNHDFTKIIFTSNWCRSGTDQVDMYMIKLPEDWVSLLP